MIYFLGMISVSLGIVMCVKCELGISPVSSLPYVFSLIFPVSFGTFTMLFHLINTFIQYLGEKKLKNVRVFMQVPVAIVFGRLIDLIKRLMCFNASGAGKIFLLLGSIFFTALGMACMLEMELAQNPPDGTVALVSEKTGMEIGKVKNLYDIAVTLAAILVSVLATKKIAGFGIATIISALFVGRLLTIIRSKIKFNV